MYFPHMHYFTKCINENKNVWTELLTHEPSVEKETWSFESSQFLNNVSGLILCDACKAL